MPSCCDGFRIFSHGYFVGQKFFLVGTSLIPKFFYWVLGRSNIFSSGYIVGPNFFCRGYFVSPKFFLADIRGSEIFSRQYFVDIFGP